MGRPDTGRADRCAGGRVVRSARDFFSPGGWTDRNRKTEYLGTNNARVEGAVAARKKTARKKTTRKKTTAKALIKRVDREITAISKDVEKRLAPLRREIQKAERQAGTEASRLLRQARARLNKVEIKGTADWQKFLRQRRRDISKALGQIESAVRPKAKKKTARRKKARARA